MNNGFLASLGARAIGAARTPMPVVAPLQAQAHAEDDVRDGARGFFEFPGEPATDADIVPTWAGSTAPEASPATHAGSPPPPVGTTVRSIGTLDRASHRAAPAPKRDGGTTPNDDALAARRVLVPDPSRTDADTSRRRDGSDRRGDRDPLRPDATDDRDPDLAAAVDRLPPGHPETTARSDRSARPVESARAESPARDAPAIGSTALAAVLARIREMTQADGADDPAVAARPIVRISIGRIEVRAAPVPAPVVHAPRPGAPLTATVPALADFLSRPRRAAP